MLSWFGSLVTFQVTFTELFIAATVITAAAYRFGWRSVELGSVIGAAGVAVLAAALQVAAYRIALHWLDWISALLLLGFGLYLAYEFVTGLRDRHGADTAPHGAGWNLPVNAAGIGVAAWALVAEGLEILVVWLGVSLREGAATATAGVGAGLVVIALLGLLLRNAGIFRRVPPYVLDGLAAVMVTGYGAYFLWLAYSGAA